MIDGDIEEEEDREDNDNQMDGQDDMEEEGVSYHLYR